MNSASVLLIVNGALTALEELLPRLGQLRANGEIIAEQQAEVQARYASLKTRADGQFSGPEWQT